MEHYLNSLLIPKLVFDKRLKYLKYRGFRQSKHIAEFSCKFNKNTLQVLPNGKLSFKIYEKEGIKIGVVLSDDFKNAYLCAYSYKSRNIDFLLVLREYQFYGELQDKDNDKLIERFFTVYFKNHVIHDNPYPIFYELHTKLKKKGYTSTQQKIERIEIFSVNDRFSIGLLVLKRYTKFDFNYIVVNKLFEIYFEVFKSSALYYI